MRKATAGHDQISLRKLLILDTRGYNVLLLLIAWGNSSSSINI